jgi:hypothetical protein
MFLFILLLLFLVLLLVSPLIVGIVLLARKRVKAGRIILGIYGTLIVLFLVHAQFDKRSTFGHILRWFKGEGGIKQNVIDLAEDAKKSADPVELQHWAMTILAEPQPTNSDSEIPGDKSYFEIPGDKVPASIQNLESSDMLFPDVTCDSAESVATKDRTVWITWGGPMGHWGIRVGSPTFKVTPTNAYNYWIEWKPGIYFWCETR